jgi:hypothetical protein
MPPKKRKISDLTTGDANSLLRALNDFQDVLDDEDEDLPSALLSALEEFRTKLQAIQVCKTSDISAVQPCSVISLSTSLSPRWTP